jgi:multimeric flavodoxin WrbA
MSIVLLQGSSREDGNTEILSQLIVKDVLYTEIKLRDLNIRPITDQRHDKEGFESVDDDYNSVIDKVLEANLIIFATPLYWYGMSGHMKNFVDRWSQSLRDKRLSFKEVMSKKAGIVVICGGDYPKIKGLPLVQQFSYIFDFMGMEFDDYIIGKGSKPGDVLQDHEALAKAGSLNERIIKELGNECNR